METEEYYGGTYPDPPEIEEEYDELDEMSYYDEIVDDIRLGLRRQK